MSESEQHFAYSVEYKRRRLAHFKYQIVFISGLIAFCIALPFISKYPVVGGEAVILLVLLLFSFVVYAEHSLNSDVVTDTHGLRRYWYGHLWKTVRWDDIKSVRLFSYQLLGDSYRGIGTSILYELRVSDRWIPAFLKRGPIVFAGTIPNADELCKIINEHIQRQNLPIIDKRVETKNQLVMMDHLPSPPRLNLPNIS
jgi:hypothetical protein